MPRSGLGMADLALEVLELLVGIADLAMVLWVLLALDHILPTY